MIVHWKIVRYLQGEQREVMDEVAEERAFKIVLDGQFLTTLYCLPAELEYLVLGHLWHLGKIRHPAEVAQIEVLAEEIRVSCRPGRTSYPPVSSSPLRADPGELFSLVKALDEEPLFSRTGGVHVGIWGRGGEVIFRTADTGRYNVLDKLTGFALTRGISPSELVLGFSGRMTRGIMEKVARLGVKLIVSPAAPTSAGLELALKKGITVVGFVRQGRLNVYTYPERLFL
ncbi:formate dehydrogenase subunit FdhD [Ammonifex degensii KC4]|uniref:Protein FdhD n=1 Tax=Ammonifex degensii (strain DSM 10501 / KC4) TaxID=429009 RepID=C9RAP7_AMMDK|nr:formate dehydrogenase accessory sulfurtransferase FdhD [Ammonifex degensii]ACX51324.1 formate dehydrogenase subunit FdhD [Ammonifex degensii KC4]